MTATPNGVREGRPTARKPLVLHLFPSLRVGGMERQALNIVRSLRHHERFDVLAAGLGRPGPILAELHGLGLTSVPAYPLDGMARASTAVQVLRFAAHLRRMGVDILHTHDFYTNTFGLAAAAIAGVPVRVASRRELDVFTPAQRRLERLMCRMADVVAANCWFLREQLIQEGVPKEKVTVLPNGVGATRARGALDSQAARAALGLAPTAPIVTMVANFHNVKKDFRTVACCMRRLESSYPGAVLFVVGSGTPPPELGEQIARGLVRVAGPQPDATPWIHSADVCILSSSSEGLSNAVMEYMAAGRPVVASAVGGMTELIEHERTGLVVPPGDAAALATAVCRLLDDPRWAESLGRAAQAHIHDRFSNDRQHAAVEALYCRLMAKRSLRIS